MDVLDDHTAGLLEAVTNDLHMFGALYSLDDYFDESAGRGGLGYRRKCAPWLTGGECVRLACICQLRRIAILRLEVQEKQLFNQKNSRVHR